MNHRGKLSDLHQEEMNKRIIQEIQNMAIDARNILGQYQSKQESIKPETL